MECTQKVFLDGLRDLMIRCGIHTLKVQHGSFPDCSAYNPVGRGMFQFSEITVDGPDTQIENFSI